MTPNIGYMHSSVIKYYYDQLNSGSCENYVDHLWNNILLSYFTSEKNYGIELQQRPWLGSGNNERDDFTIRYISYISNGQERKKVVLIEDKRISEETSDATWKTAVEQVTDYMKAASAGPSQDKKDIMYAIVTVGHYSRFYYLSPPEASLRDYPSAGGKLFEFKMDEEAIDRFLLELVAETQ